jgi:transposase
MSYEIEPNYETQWLFPPSLEDLLPANHPARMVREFVDAQELEELGFKVRGEEEGRPSYSRKLLLKVWLYGYMTKNRSCRGLERACLDQMGMLWLTGMHRPDHTTLWRFWRDNQKGIGELFRQLLQIGASLKLVGMVLHAVDGTKILSQASEQKGWHEASLEEKLKRIDKAINEILKQTEQAGSEGSGDVRLPEELEDRKQLREKVQDQLRQLRQKQRQHMNPGDEDARMMKCRTGKHFAYNAQAVVDEQSGLIVAADVVTDESDNYQLVPMLTQVEENLGKVSDQNVTDAGYFATVELAKAEQKGYPVLMNLPEPMKEHQEGFSSSRFEYNAENDYCICPQGEVLNFENTKRRDKTEAYEVRVYRCHSYENCPVRWQCSSSKTGRTVQIHPNHDALVRQRIQHRDPAMRAVLKRRGAIVESVFGWSKAVMEFRRWTVRGKEKVRMQWRLHCTALNLLRLYKYWAIGKLVFV